VWKAALNGEFLAIGMNLAALQIQRVIRGYLVRNVYGLQGGPAPRPAPEPGPGLMTRYLSEVDEVRRAALGLLWLGWQRCVALSRMSALRGVGLARMAALRWCCSMPAVLVLRLTKRP
jgi:hypothetical protein